ncbi:MAG TPA: hypothetical protein VGK17_00025 [Propionicimonas sp.]
MATPIVPLTGAAALPEPEVDAEGAAVFWPQAAKVSPIAAAAATATNLRIAALFLDPPPQAMRINLLTCPSGKPPGSDDIQLCGVRLDSAQKPMASRW